MLLLNFSNKSSFKCLCIILISFNQFYQFLCNSAVHGWNSWTFGSSSLINSSTLYTCLANMNLTISKDLHSQKQKRRQIILLYLQVRVCLSPHNEWNADIAQSDDMNIFLWTSAARDQILFKTRENKINIWNLNFIWIYTNTTEFDWRKLLPGLVLSLFLKRTNLSKK